jgi:hypothetical protein
LSQNARYLYAAVTIALDYEGVETERPEEKSEKEEEPKNKKPVEEEHFDFTSFKVKKSISKE